MIYDKFVQDAEWNRLNDALHVPGLTYRERDALRGSLDNREAVIRKEEDERFLEIREKHREDKRKDEDDY